MTRDDIIRMARGATLPEPRWYESIQPGDFVVDKADGSVAVVVSVHKQRPIAPDYFRLDFADGSYLDATDNEISSEYRPYLLPSKIAAAEREACADICDQHASIEGIAQRCAAAIRAKGQA